MSSVTSSLRIVATKIKVPKSPNSEDWNMLHTPLCHRPKIPFPE